MKTKNEILNHLIINYFDKFIDNIFEQKNFFIVENPYNQKNFSSRNTFIVVDEKYKVEEKEDFIFKKDNIDTKEFSEFKNFAKKQVLMKKSYTLRSKDQKYNELTIMFFKYLVNNHLQEFWSVIPSEHKSFMFCKILKTNYKNTMNLFNNLSNKEISCDFKFSNKILGFDEFVSNIINSMPEDEFINIIKKIHNSYSELEQNDFLSLLKRNRLLFNKPEILAIKANQSINNLNNIIESLGELLEVSKSKDYLYRIDYVMDNNLVLSLFKDTITDNQYGKILKAINATVILDSERFKIKKINYEDIKYKSYQDLHICFEFLKNTEFSDEDKIKREKMAKYWIKNLFASVYKITELSMDGLTEGLKAEILENVYTDLKKEKELNLLNLLDEKDFTINKKNKI